MTRRDEPSPVRSTEKGITRSMLSAGEIRDKISDLEKRIDTLGRHL